MKETELCSVSMKIHAFISQLASLQLKRRLLNFNLSAPQWLMTAGNLDREGVFSLVNFTTELSECIQICFSCQEEFLRAASAVFSNSSNNRNTGKQIGKAGALHMPRKTRYSWNNWDMMKQLEWPLCINGQILACQERWGEKKEGCSSC